MNYERAAASARDRAEQIRQVTADLARKKAKIQKLISRIPDEPRGSGGSGPTISAPASGKASIVVNAALSRVGKPYVWGAAGPNSFDCSGLMLWAYKKVGMNLPHYTGSQYNMGTRISSRGQVRPANLLLRRRNPVSTSLARDTGTWATITSIIHVILGFQVHGNPDNTFGFLNYFLADGIPKVNSFGLGNWTGLAALVIVAGLLALSNDRSLRELKARRWKNLQRMNYALFALVVLHAIFYGALLRMTSPFTLLLLLTVVAVLAGQAVGIRLWRRRNARTGEARAGQPSEATGATP